MAEHLLARRGRLWAWTTQEFPPPSPPYAGPTGEAFEPYGVGYVELADEVKVEARLTCAEGLRTGMDMELVVVPFRITGKFSRCFIWRVHHRGHNGIDWVIGTALRSPEVRSFARRIGLFTQVRLARTLQQENAPQKQTICRTHQRV
jgi:hypothetical protein